MELPNVIVPACFFHEQCTSQVPIDSGMATAVDNQQRFSMGDTSSDDEGSADDAAAQACKCSRTQAPGEASTST